MRIGDVQACVLRIEGTNCEDETYNAFRALGASAERVHLNQLVRDVAPNLRRRLEDYHLLVIPGGFSSGDYVRAGAIWAARVRSRLLPDLEAFVDDEKPVIGVCNGFQVLVEMGFLPAINGISDSPEMALATNDSAHYECRPSLLRYENHGTCGPLSGFQRGQVMLAPSAHTEGKVTFAIGEEKMMLDTLTEADQILFRYVDPQGEYAGYPWNPNGSFDDLAGICNPAGNVIGLMPHPERSFYRHLYPDWTREAEGSSVEGRLFFESILRYVTKAF